MHMGTDLDGVIIDHTHNKRFLMEKRGFFLDDNELARESIQKYLTLEDYTIFKRELYDGMGMSAPPMPGAHAALTSLAAAGHELRLISRRKYPRFAIEWLKQNGFYDFFGEARAHFVSIDDEKEHICREHGVELHIDDLPEVMEKLKTPRYRILFGYHEPTHPAATAVAKTWGDVVGYIALLV